MPPSQNEFMKRIENLKQKLFALDDRAIFLERLEILKDCAHKYAGETPGVRFAHTLGELLDNISVVIDPDDVIVGRIHEVVPTVQQERFFSANQEYWCPEWFRATGGMTISWETLLKKGLKGIKEDAQKKLANIDYAKNQGKKDFLRGVVLCCDAIANFARRYSAVAFNLIAQQNVNIQHAPGCENLRQIELRHIAEICKRVPEYPPRTFHEAIQAIWFVDLVLHAVVGARDFSLGRLDQHLYPFYARDIQTSGLTRERALELLQYLFIKCNELIGLSDYQDSKKRSLCYDSVQYLTIGGQTTDGEDATNPISFLCLEAGKIKLKQPMLIVRYFDGINKDFWKKTCELARDGGSVSIYNDGVVIPALLNCGIDRQEAINYVYRGCCNISMEGKDGSLMMSWHSLPKFLELALNDATDVAPDLSLGKGEQLGCKIGDGFLTFDELFSAFEKQLKNAMRKERERYLQKKTPIAPTSYGRFSLESCFLPGCLENAMDWQYGGTKYSHILQVAGAGIATLADSLTVIKKLVFEEKEMSLTELVDILKADFEGNELLQQKLINRYSKFGNDDDYVDSLAVRAAEVFCREVIGQNSGDYLVKFVPKIYSHLFHISLGKMTGATADGRKKGEPISENQSPTHGADKSGLTASLNSMAKLPFKLSPAGGTTLFIHPSAVKGKLGIDILSNLIEGYFQNGGMHLHINVVDRNTLLDAQQHPEKYRTLSVRVTGYSAYFVQLNSDIQAEIIARTEHEIQSSELTSFNSEFAG